MIKISAFLFSLLCFLLYLINHRRREKKAEAIPIKNDNMQSAGNPPIGEKDFYNDRLKTLYAMLEDAIEEERREEAKVKHIKILNQFGAVINENNANKAHRELYLARRKKLSIQNQIRSTEKARAKK